MPIHEGNATAPRLQLLRQGSKVFRGLGLKLQGYRFISDVRG